MFAGKHTAETSGLSLADIEGFLTRTATLDPGTDSAEAIDQIAALERAKAAATAAQAQLTARVHANQTARDRARGIDSGTTARCVGGQVALARRESPHRGNRHLGLALALTKEMPHALKALTQGRIGEWQATLLVRATSCLSADDRTLVDEEMSPRLGELSDARLEAAAKAAAARLDPASVTARRRRAESDRRVSVRPAPDTMTYLSGLLPVKDGVACHAALTAAADAARAAGDPRTRGQIMADTLTARVTGRDPAIGVDVEINLIMGTDTFFGSGSTPGFVPGFGSIPADLAFAWAHPKAPSATNGNANAHPANGSNASSSPSTPAPAEGATNIFGSGTCADISGRTESADCAEHAGAQYAKRFLRRLFATPDLDKLVGMESTRRDYTGLLAKFLIIRDQTCSMPGCDAPIRHLDHVQRHADGGKTTAANAQGLCEGCNYLKEHPDWRVTVEPATETPRAAPSDEPEATRDTGARHQTVWTTPTGHTYRSGPPPPLGF